MKISNNIEGRTALGAPLRALALLSTSAAALALFSSPALAQDSAPQAAASDEEQPVIVVTGSILNNPAAATASPVVSLTADDLEKRGIVTVSEALQTLTANNAGTVPSSWSSFGFTTGASAPSLRGFNDAYTLVLFDGMRTAVYPLADDTQRNIVDINTIPNSVVSSVDTLLDGASSTYGSDAIAGVINVITKRQIQGLHMTGSLGMSQHGDAVEKRASASYGIGDLGSDGYNIYISAEYQNTEPLYSRARGYPFNSADLSGICGTDAQGCLFNSVRNGIQYDGSYAGFQSSRANAVRPYSTGLVAQGRFQYLNGCQGLTAYNLTPTQLASTATAPSTVCQEDLLSEYQMYNAEISRKGGTLRATKAFGDSEVFAMFNFYNTTTFNEGTPRGWLSSTAAGGRRVTVSRIFLPVYVCPQGTAVVGSNPATGNISGDLIASGCNASNGTLNPNNPFASSGNLAFLSGIPDRGIQTYTDAKVYRGAIGAHGSFGSGWAYNLGVTASEVTLDIDNRNYVYLQGLMDAIAKGTYNFVNPSANSQAVIDSIFKPTSKRATSKLVQVQGALGKDVFALPGGMLNVAVGGQFRHEELDNPSANPANDANPYARYYTINSVAVKGKRDIWSLSYEISAPIIDQLRLKASGSYDHYSTGQEAFAPKFEAEFSPIKQVKLRGTFSKGFRAPNFNESFQLPATGYTNASIVCSSPTYTAFCAAHSSNPTYYTGGYSPGLTSSGNPNLSPEKSTSYTAGIVLQPKSSITFTVDYWHTKIKNLIVPASASAAIYNAYYTNNGVVNIPGVKVIPGNPDPLNPTALPLLGFIETPFSNANAFLGEGIDFSASVKLPITDSVTLRSQGNASYLMRLQQENDDGSVWRFDGTLGPCGWTSCSGAPAWRATWQNTFEYKDRASLTLTASYTAGYSPVAADSGGTYGDCAQSAADGQLVVYDNGDAVQCHVNAVFNLDTHGEVKLNDNLKMYFDVLNILNSSPPLDVNAGYASYQFNPAWADRQFIGRYFRIGAKLDF